MIDTKKELQLKLMFLEDDKEKLEIINSAKWTGEQHREYVDINRQIFEINRELESLEIERDLLLKQLKEFEEIKEIE